jgi:hypothetical protein
MTFSWYCITISSLEEGETIYNGYFKVDNDCNLVVEFYETKDGIIHELNIADGEYFNCKLEFKKGSGDF